MLINRERQKLIHAIVYFAMNTKNCGKVKLFKLLYFLDFEHFKTTGRSVTGLKYCAWRMGPVPTCLFEELKDPKPDFTEAIQVSEIPTSRANPMMAFRPTADFDQDIFSSRELQLLQKLSEEYFDTEAKDMIEATHLENLPWDKVYNQMKSPKSEIPYEYALKLGERDEMLGMARERERIIEAFR